MISQPKRALLSASVAGTAVGLHHSTEKLSIYPSPTPDILLVESPSELEKQIGGARRKVLNTYAEGHAYVQGWVSKWIGVEHAVENRVKSIISPNESLTPGLLYVGIATLSGSILARNRILPTRLLLPPIFLLASANHFLPQTTKNLSSYLSNLEDTYLPTLAQKHEVAKAHTQMSWEMMKEATKGGRDQVNRGAVVVVEKVQEVTGLKLRETLGWAEAKVEEKVVEAKKPVEAAKAAVDQKVENVAQKVENVEKKAERKVENVEKKVEKKTEEGKRLV
ncbi:apolipo protein O-domain-containing protein [Crassisporium funariophilum]|nr:apolipo protein O-domain-containing protein [Crassisporium funariophilum]